MSKLKDHLSCIVAGLKAQPALTNLPVQHILRLQDVWEMGRGVTKVFVLWGGFKKTGPGYLASPEFTPGVFGWVVVLYLASFRSADDTLFAGSENFFDLYEAVKKLRAVPLVSTGTNPVLLELGDVLPLHSDLVGEGAGPGALAFEFQTGETAA